MKILHPTDFSATAEKAGVLAADLMERLGAHLHIVHVQERFEDAGANPMVRVQMEQLSPEMLDRLEQQRSQETKRLRERLDHLAPAGATVELIWGTPLPELLAIAAEYDLIVMGAHGASRFDQVFLGGVAGRLVRRSPVPVLTVRDEATATQVGRIMVATDFGPAAKEALRFSKRLAEHGIRLVVAHVLGRDGGTDTRPAVEQLEAFAAGVPARHVVRAGSAVKELPRIADEVAADVIAIGVRHHSSAVGLLLGSRADSLLRSSPVPVLSVPYLQPD